MPEGDTLFRTATVLRSVLVDTRIEMATTSTNPRDDGTVDATLLQDRSVSKVEARGKHLLIHLDDGSALHSHLGMTGSWHTYKSGEKWQKPSRQASLVMRNDAGREVICFTPKTLELLSPTALRRHPWLSRLGPDILAYDLDVGQCVRRCRTVNGSSIGVAIMNQQVLCGIGNVYKSEALFQQRLNPFSHVEEFSNDQLESLIRHTRSAMRRNLEGHPRTTRLAHGGNRKWVYRRSGEPCFVCGTTISMRRQGDLGRSTYYCQQCQRTKTGSASCGGVFEP